MTTEQILKFIEKNPQFNIKGAGFQRKNVNGEFIEESSLALYVEKKKPLGEIPADQIIPTGIYVDGLGFIKTDVLQARKIVPSTCSQCNPSGQKFVTSMPVFDPSIRAYRDIVRPLQGGVSISSIPSGTSTHENTNYVGTLGFIAIDELDGSLVGVTNAHVAATNLSITGEGVSAHHRVLNSPRFKTATDVYNFYGYRIEQSSRLDFANEIVMRLGNDYDPYSSYTDGRYQNALTVGYLKRYMPLVTGDNSMDCAILGLGQQTLTGIISVLGRNNVTASTNVGREILGNASWQILGHDLMGNQRYYPFATTQEINSITSTEFRNQGTASSPNLIMAGRTTGLKGQPNNPASSLTNASCILEAISNNYLFNNADWGNIILNFRNTLTYKWKNCNNVDTSLGGDSGSAILAKFNNVWKIIGLHFASEPVKWGGSGMGIGIRIDHIAPLLKIKPYMGQPINNPATANAGTGKRLIVKNKQSLPFFTYYDNRVYYQIGTTTERHLITEIGEVAPPTQGPACLSFNRNLFPNNNAQINTTVNPGYFARGNFGMGLDYNQNTSEILVGNATTAELNGTNQDVFPSIFNINTGVKRNLSQRGIYPRYYNNGANIISSVSIKQQNQQVSSIRFFRTSDGALIGTLLLSASNPNFDPSHILVNDTLKIAYVLLSGTGPDNLNESRIALINLNTMAVITTLNLSSDNYGPSYDVQRIFLGHGGDKIFYVCREFVPNSSIRTLKIIYLNNERTGPKLFWNFPVVINLDTAQTGTKVWHNTPIKETPDGRVFYISADNTSNTPDTNLAWFVCKSPSDYPTNATFTHHVPNVYKLTEKQSPGYMDFDFDTTNSYLYIVGTQLIRFLNGTYHPTLIKVNLNGGDLITAPAGFGKDVSQTTHRSSTLMYWDNDKYHTYNPSTGPNLKTDSEFFVKSTDKGIIHSSVSSNDQLNLLSENNSPTICGL